MSTSTETTKTTARTSSRATRHQQAQQAPHTAPTRAHAAMRDWRCYVLRRVDRDLAELPAKTRCVKWAITEATHRVANQADPRADDAWALTPLGHWYAQEVSDRQRRAQARTAHSA